MGDRKEWGGGGKRECEIEESGGGRRVKKIKKKRK